MDAKDPGGNGNGNGNAHPDPEIPAPPASTLPAAAAPPSASPWPAVPRDAKGRILPGHSLGGHKPKGVPHRNTELHRIFTTNEMRYVLKLAKEQAKKGKNALLEFLLERVLIKLTPEATTPGGVTINNTHSNMEQNVTPLLLGDPVARDLVARLEEHLATRMESGGNGAARQ